MKANVRLATHSDTARIAEIVNAAYQPYIVRIGRPPAPMHADYRHVVAEKRVFVVSDERELQGILVLAPKLDCMLVENVAVHPRFQGMGLGRELMLYAEECARRAGLSVVQLYTNAVMVENICYYRRLGYREIDRRDEDGFQRVFMRKEVPPSSR